MLKKLWMPFLMCMLIAWTGAPELGAETNPGGAVEAEIQGRTIHFPTLKSDYRVTVEGDLATVTLTQTFANPADQPLNAVYLFPLSTGAAVYEMVMEVGDERVLAKIKRVEEARRDYEAAKTEGKAAALLTQKRPNMFTQEIANLMPGHEIKVTISYVEAAPRTDGWYELVLPLVVGPRYQPEGAGQDPAALGEEFPAPAGPRAEAGSPVSARPPIAVDERLQARPDSTQQYGQWELETLPAYPPVSGLTIPKIIEEDRVSLDLKIKAGFPIAGASSQTHELSVEKTSDRELHIGLARGRAIDNRDLVVRWQLAGEAIQAGVLAHKDHRGGFFSLLIEPPALAAADQIVPRELVFVLDTSGSMSGSPLEASKKFMTWALKTLRPTDTFRLITFSSDALEYAPRPLAASPENLAKAQDYISDLTAGGGTETAKAVIQAFKEPPEANRLRLVVFLTDGYIGNEAQVLGVISQLIGPARIFAVGVGDAVNRYLLEEMARAGRGWCRILSPSDNNDETIQALAAKLNDPVLTGLTMDWGGLKVKGENPKTLPDLFAGQSLRIVGRYEKGGTYTMAVSGWVNGRRARLPLKVELPDQAVEGGPQAIPLIWAKGEISEVMRVLTNPTEPGRDLEALKETVTVLGLDFNLVTQWTAFVAVSEKIVNESRKAADSQVPLPQAAGVEAPAYGLEAQGEAYDQSSAYGGGSQGGAGTPEPAVMSGLALMAAAGWAALRRRTS